MSSTAAVAPNVTYHLAKPVDNSFVHSHSVNNPVYSKPDAVISRNCNFSVHNTPSRQGIDKNFVDSTQLASSSFDAAIRNSLKLIHAQPGKIDGSLSTFEIDAKKINPTIAFQESSAPPLDAVILQRIQALPKYLILTDSDGPYLKPRGIDTLLCTDSELACFCHTGGQYVPRQSLGLGNAGNTCYLNSVIQCLLATGPLLAYISLKHSNPNSCVIATGQATTLPSGITKNRFCALCGLLRLLKEHTQRIQSNGAGRFDHFSGGQIVPSYFVGNVRAVCPSLRPYQQEDAHEFLLGLLSRMEDSAMAGLGKLPRRVTETNVIRRIFGSVVRSEVTCHSCRKVSARDEQCFNLSVDITCGRSLQQCLFNYIRNEELCGQNAYKCENCRQLQTAIRKCTIHQGAPILIIQFNRFSRSQKLDTRVEYPSSFNLRPFMTDSKGPPVLYRLYATVNHEGFSCRSGHYVAYTRRNGVWLLHNDSFVTAANSDNVLRQTPYLLFYEAVEPCPKPEVSTGLVTQSAQKAPSINEVPKQEVASPLQIPVSHIPLPSTPSPLSVSSIRSSTTVTTATTTLVATKTTTTPSVSRQPLPSTPRIVFNPSISRSSLFGSHNSVHGSTKLHSPTKLPVQDKPRVSEPFHPTSKQSVVSTQSSAIRQALFGDMNPPDLWSGRPTPTSPVNTSVGTVAPSSAQGDATFGESPCIPLGKRKRSPSASDSRKATRSSPDVHSSNSSINSSLGKNIPQNSLPTSQHSPVPTNRLPVTDSGDSSDSSIVWIPSTHNTFPGKFDQRYTCDRTDSFEDCAVDRKRKGNKTHLSVNSNRHRPGPHHATDKKQRHRHRHHRRRHKDSNRNHHHDYPKHKRYRDSGTRHKPHHVESWRTNSHRSQGFRH